MLLTVGTRTYTGLSPVTTDDAKLLRCLLASYEHKHHWFPIAHIQFFQKAAAVISIVDLMHIKDYEEQNEGGMHETNWIFKQTPLPHFCLKVVCKKGGRMFGSLWYVQENNWYRTLCTLSGSETLQNANLQHFAHVLVITNKNTPIKCNQDGIFKWIHIFASHTPNTIL